MMNWYNTYTNSQHELRDRLKAAEQRRLVKQVRQAQRRPRFSFSWPAFRIPQPRPVRRLRKALP
jgi:hypothetical protein